MPSQQAASSRPIASMPSATARRRSGSCPQRPARDPPQSRLRRALPGGYPPADARSRRGQQRAQRLPAARRAFLGDGESRAAFSPEPQPVSLHRTAPAMRASPQKRLSGKKSGYTRISRQAGARATCRRCPDFRDVSPPGGRTRDNRMPPKIRELVGDLERAGFANRGGKGSHRNFVHPRLAKPITISGRLGDDARRYQIRAVRRAIEESRR